MKTLAMEEAGAHLASCIDLAQNESVLITRDGKPAAVIIGAEGCDPEDLRLQADPSFWAMIEERRLQPTMSREELEEFLRNHDSQAGPGELTEHNQSLEGDMESEEAGHSG